MATVDLSGTPVERALEGICALRGLKELTKREYAAIHLRVPRSGDPELDAMIREANRMDLIAAMFSSPIASGTHLTDIIAEAENMIAALAEFDQDSDDD